MKMAAEYGRKDKTFTSDRIYLKEFPKKKSFIEALQSLDGGVQSQMSEAATLFVKSFVKNELNGSSYQEFVCDFNQSNIQ